MNNSGTALHPRRNVFAGFAAAALLTGVYACEDRPEPAAPDVSQLSQALPPPTPSGKKTCNRFVVNVGSRTFSGKLTAVVPAAQVGPTIRVTGTHVTFQVVANTFEVRAFTLTGAPAQVPIVRSPTVVFTSKRPVHGDNLNGPLSIKLNNQQLVLERAGRRQDMKIQSNDCNQGGLFQMEPEPGTTEVHTLAGAFRYFKSDPATGRLFFTNQTTVLGYDSPELATRISNTPTVARWAVRSGGRMGMVIGEDAFEALQEAQ